MALFELLIAVLLAGAVLTAWAQRAGIPYPPLLALAGALAALVPGAPEIVLDPSLALALFVAPVLLDAAYDASPRDLRANWGPVAMLVVLAVGVTIACVAVAVRIVAPWALGPAGMPWAAAVVLGAIVAPPDAAAAGAVLRRLHPPHRLMVILEGESLLNDATALLVYRVAIAAAITGAVDWRGLPLMLLVTCGGGVVLGGVAAKLVTRVAGFIREELSVDVLVQFLSTFAVWILADRLGLSAIITMVAYAMTVARSAPLRTGGARRIASYAVWEVAVFVLNVLAFVLMGLQLKSILLRLDGAWPGYAAVAAVVLAVAVAARMAVVLATGIVMRGGQRLMGQSPTTSWRGGMLISWCGMRGVVTLAAALALPHDFPARDLILFAAFVVTIGTLAGQGLTLGPLLGRLGLQDDGTVAHEVLAARRATLEAAHRLVLAHPSPAAAMLGQKYAARLRNSDEAGEAPRDELYDLRRAAITAARAELTALRSRGVIGDTAFHAIEEEIDLDELSADPRLRMGPPTPDRAVR